MHIMKQPCITLAKNYALSLAVICSGNIAQAGPDVGAYHFRNLPVPDGAMAAINNEGTVTGFYYDNTGFAHSFLWQDGLFTALDAPGWLDTDAFGINNRGIVVGTYDDQVVQYGFLFDLKAQTWTRLTDPPGTSFNQVNEIKDKGMMVGFAGGGNYTTLVGWISHRESWSFFTAPDSNGGNADTFAAGINDRGVVTGYYHDLQNIWRSFIKDDSKLISITFPGAVETIAFGINNQGDIAGTYAEPGAPPLAIHGFVLHHGKFTVVDYPGTHGVTFVNGINDRGQLVGNYFDPSGTVPAFLATPA